MRRDTDIGADMPGGISLGAALTEEQAEEIYNQGKEAVVFALLEMSKKLAEQQSPPTPAPCTPSGMLYSGCLIFCLFVCYSGYYLFDSVRLRWCLSAIFLLFCLMPVLLFVPAVLHPSLLLKVDVATATHTSINVALSLLGVDCARGLAYDLKSETFYLMTAGPTYSSSTRTRALPPVSAPCRMPWAVKLWDSRSIPERTRSTTIGEK